jgi:apolipoprotein N-acyltransferase
MRAEARRRLEFALPFLSAALLLLSFPPASVWPLAWVALLPWLVYVLDEPKAWRALLLSYAGGFSFFAVGLAWMRHVAVVAPPTGGLVYGLHWLLFAWAARSLRGPRWLTWPVAWMTLEWLRGVTPHVLLPWFYLGHSQIHFHPLAQAADLGGVLPISGLMIAFAALSIDAVRSWFAGRRPFLPTPSWKRQAIGWGATLAILIAYGAVRVATLDVEEGPALLLVQPNIPQDNKEIALKLRESPEKRREWMEKIYERNLRLMERGVAAETPAPDLVVWPEAAIVHAVVAEAGVSPTRLVHNGDLVSEPARRHGVPLLVGLVLYEMGNPPDSFNTALLVGPDGALQGRYDKIILVPFGEYVPFGSLLRGLVGRYTGLGEFHDSTPGAEPAIFEAGGVPFGTVICFEGVMPELCRRIARKGARFIVNISNDGWFRDSSELDQILAIARFRSIENRIGFVRATNTGISAFIGPDGAVRSRLAAPDGRTKEVEGTLRDRVALGRGGSPYRFWGEWWLLGAALAAVGFEILARRRLTRPGVDPILP